MPVFEASIVPFGDSFLVIGERNMASRMPFFYYDLLLSYCDSVCVLFLKLPNQFISVSNEVIIEYLNQETDLSMFDYRGSDSVGR